MDSVNIPGLSIAVINDSKVVYNQTFGFANLEKKIPITSKTIFEGASISKSIFAFFVMQFVEEGKLYLDKPLHEYLPYEDIAYDDMSIPIIFVHLIIIINFVNEQDYENTTS